MKMRPGLMVVLVVLVGSLLLWGTTGQGVIERVSVDSAGVQGNDRRFQPSLSADGRFVAFQSIANNLVVGDTNSFDDIFIRDTCVGAPAGCTPSTIRVSVDSAGTQANGGSVRPAISAVGRFVAFESFASNLVMGDTSVFEDVFVRDTCVGGGRRAARPRLSGYQWTAPGPRATPAVWVLPSVLTGASSPLDPSPPT